MTSGSITIEDVAKAAGVSRQTVSRVINRQPNVRDSVREGVEAAIAKLGYVPNQAARRMGGAKSYTILAAFEAGAVGRDQGRLPLDDMLVAGMKTCADAGYHLLFEELQHANEKGAYAKQMARALTALQPDGVILLPSLEENVEIRNLLSGRGISTEFLGMRSEFGRMVPGLDDGAFGEAAAEHLLARGHRQVGFLSGLHNTMRSRRRLEGYRRAMVKVGSRAHGHFVSEKPLDFDQALELARTWLSPTIRPTGIIAETEETAAAVLRAASTLKIRVPDGLSIIALDDAACLAHAEPPTTVLHQAYAPHFAAACERLTKVSPKKDAEEGKRQISDDFVLLERDSVAGPPRSK